MMSPALLAYGSTGVLYMLWHTTLRSSRYIRSMGFVAQTLVRTFLILFWPLCLVGESINGRE